MDNKELIGLTFIKCRNPTYTTVNGVKEYHTCGHCDVCLKSKADKYSLSLQLEERHHVFSYFITLTYSEECVPRYEIRDLKPYWTIDGKKRYIDKFGWQTEEICRFDKLNCEVELYPCFLRLYPVAGKRTNQYEVRDADTVNYPPIRTSLNYKQLLNYQKHRDKYVKDYSQTSVEYPHGCIDLCPKRDLELFMLRFKNFCVRRCNGAKFRYFAVPDYGTNSLRPHWHIEVFFDSYELYREFEKTRNYGTTKRPSFCAEFIADLWKYGIANSSRVERSTASYVASYLNRSSGCEDFINKFMPIRSYHSAHLGSVLSEDIIKTNMLQRNFSFFENLTDYTNNGEEFTYRWRSGLFNSFLLRYPYIDPTNINGIHQIWRRCNSFIQKCRGLYGEDVTLSSVALALYDSVSTNSPLWLQDYKRLQDYNNKPYNDDINLFYRLVLITNSINRMCVFFGLDVLHYLSLVSDFVIYRKSKTLLQLFLGLQSSSFIAQKYYSNLLTDYQDNSRSFGFLTYYNSIADSLSRNIKHKEIADLYRFN